MTFQPPSSASAHVSPTAVGHSVVADPSLVNHALVQQVKRSLLTAGVLHAKAHIMVGFSGGVDSTVLLFALHVVQQQVGFKLSAVTVDHGWRGTPAPELPHVMQCCTRWGVPLTWVSVSHADRQQKTEQHARDLRYQAFTDLATLQQVTALVTAHHADDQVETVLFRLCRGTGVTGLKGMRPSRALAVGHPTLLLRPLLPFTRPQLDDFAATHQLGGYHDPTNASAAYTRNVVRHSVLPQLRTVFPHVDGALLRLAQLADDASRVLDYQLQAVLPLVMPQPHTLALGAFSQLAPALQRPLLRHFLTPYQPELTLEHTDYLLNGMLTERESEGVLLSLGTDPHTGRNRFVSVYRGQVTVRVQPLPQSVSMPVVLTEPFTVSGLPYPATLAVAPIVDKTTYAVDGVWHILADFTPFQHLPLVWRTRQPGDRIMPEGSPHTQKLKAYLMEAGVHRFDRNTLMVLACGRNVLWVPGLVRSANIVPQHNPTHYLTCWVQQPVFAC
jgi:tRNA(Ile)-lysidine synthase